MSMTAPTDSAPIPHSVMGRIPNFDVLRLFLAFEVVVFHILDIQGVHSDWFIVNPVPAFVCLSGFVIPASFTSSRNWGHFAWKRLLRITPPLLLSFVLVAAVGGIGSLWPTFLFYLSAGTIDNIGLNIPLWSLLVEEVLYAYHAASRVLLGRWTVGMAAAAFVVCELSRHIGTPLIGMRQWRAACCFFAGNMLYFHRDRLDRLDPRWLFLLLPYLARGAYPSVWKVVNSYLDVPALAGVLVLAYRLPQIRFRMPDLSYGVYVYHYPIVCLFFRMGFLRWQLTAMTVVSTAALSCLSWYLVERRVLRLKDVRIRRSAGRGLG